MDEQKPTLPEEGRRKAQELVERAKNDPELEQRLREDPENVLREFGLPTDPDAVREMSPPGSPFAEARCYETCFLTGCTYTIEV